MAKRYKLFIAYHGTNNPQGSETFAHSLFDFLDDKGVKCFFFPKCGNRNYADIATDAAMDSDKFLLVANDFIPCDHESGKLSSKQIINELDCFYQGHDQLVSNLKGKINVLLYGGLQSSRAKLFHPKYICGEAFISEKHFSSQEELFEAVFLWVENNSHKESVYNASFLCLDSIMSQLKRDLIKRDLIAVIGPCIDRYHSEFIRGLGLSSMAYSKKSFSNACQLARRHIVDIESRFGDFFDDKPVTIAYSNLATLPFSGYITLNCDDLLERALIAQKKKIEVIIDDSDLVNWDFLAGEIPVIKLNGTATGLQKRAVVLSPKRDSFCSFDAYTGMLKVLLKLIVMGKKILFIGFDQLNDEHLPLNDCFREMGNQTENICVISNGGDGEKNDILINNNNNMLQIDMNAEIFLEMLYFSYVGHMEEMSNPLIRKLFHERIIASETQAIEIFLSQLISQISVLPPKCENIDMQIDKILAKARESHDLLMSKRPTFNTFNRLWMRILSAVDGAINKREALDEIIEHIKDERDDITRCLKKNRKLIEDRTKSATIYLFSQSLRVVDLLCSMRTSFQENSTLYIAECRAPHATTFCDAGNISKAILDQNGKYKIVWVTDSAIYSLFRKGMDAVFMGAHDILFKEGKPVAFINTCGAATVVEVAHTFGVPIYIVAESQKYVKYSNEVLEKVNKPSRVTFSIEDEQFSEFIDSNVTIENIIYELCPVYKGMTFLSDKEPIIVLDDIPLPLSPDATRSCFRS